MGKCFPGKEPDMPYTQTMEFLKFLTYRAGKHMKFRYDIIKNNDKTHFISAHCDGPSIESTGYKFEQALSRGNDWKFSDILDGYGCSHFPAWGDFDQASYGIRLETIRSANQGKEMWVSELQGGSARFGFSVSPSVDAKRQQLWILNGISKKAKGIIFWCWRDEVFGGESSGFGLIGNDGYAKERLNSLKSLSKILKKNQKLFNDYTPDPPKIGVLFEPDNYYLNWAEDGNAEKAGWSLLGYLLALERLNIPYEIIESNHLEHLKNIKLLILPWSLIINKNTQKKIIDFTESGGTLICEAELDSFNENGFYKYPGKDRKLAYKLDIEDIGRRELKQKKVIFNLFNKSFEIKPDGWQTPLKSSYGDKIFAKTREGNIIGVRSNINKGIIYKIGTFLGAQYLKTRYNDFENFLYEIIKDLKLLNKIIIMSNKNNSIMWRFGTSGNKNLLFILNPEEKTEIKVTIPENLLKDQKSITSINTIKPVKLTNEKNKNFFSVTIDKNSWDIYFW